MATVEVVMKADPKGAWTIEANNEPENLKRLAPHNRYIAKIWASRRGQAGSHVPGATHRPIVFDEGDTLQFINGTGHRIGIGVKKSDEVDEFPDAPDDPLARGVLVIDPGSSVSAEVIRSAYAEPGPRDQRFYKFHGWVEVNGIQIDVDPDGYCGG